MKNKLAIAYNFGAMSLAVGAQMDINPMASRQGQRIASNYIER